MWYFLQEGIIFPFTTSSCPEILLFGLCYPPVEDDHSDNNNNCSEGGKKNAHAKIGIFVCISKALLGRDLWRLSSPLFWDKLLKASWNWLCPAQGSPSLSSQRPGAATPILKLGHLDSMLGQRGTFLYSSLSGSLLMAAQVYGASATPPSCVWAAKVLKVHSVPLTRPLKGLNRTPVLTPVVLGYRLASSRTLCHWSQPSEPCSSARFSPPHCPFI